MKLLTKAIAKKLPPIYTHDGKLPSDIPVPLKIFNPSGIGTWYIYEYDPETQMCFGMCVLQEAELGYVSLDELRALKSSAPFRLPMERDKWWSGKTLRDVAEYHKCQWLLDQEPELH